MGKKIAALAQPQDMRLAPHCSIGPVALCAALHFGWSTPQVMIQEDFSQYDVPWRSELVCVAGASSPRAGWDPSRRGEFALPDNPGLGIELNVEACARHPYQRHTFPSLWDQRWVKQFTPSGERGA
jgi:galactonate dehydratase